MDDGDKADSQFRDYYRSSCQIIGRHAIDIILNGLVTLFSAVDVFPWPLINTRATWAASCAAFREGQQKQQQQYLDHYGYQCDSLLLPTALIK